MSEEIKKGNDHYFAGRFTEAIGEYTRAIEIDRKQPFLYSNRALAELKLKMYTEARQDAEEAVELSESSSTEQRVKNYRILSEALLGLDLLDESLTICRKGLELDPRDSTLMLRAREINATKMNRDIDTMRFREDPQVTRYKTGQFDLNDMKEALERTKLVNPPSGEILVLNNSQMTRMREMIKTNAQAHQWFHGMGGKKVDRKRAFQNFEKTAKLKNAEGIYNLGLFYSKGFDVSLII